MKRIIPITFLLILIPCIVWAWSTPLQTSISSGEQTASASIYAGDVAITAICIITDGTNNAKVIIDDSTDGSGTVVGEMSVKGADHYGGRIYMFPVEFTTGIYVTLTGTGASYIVEYIPR